jgi:hypothetical protein
MYTGQQPSAERRCRNDVHAGVEVISKGDEVRGWPLDHLQILESGSGTALESYDD